MTLYRVLRPLSTGHEVGQLVDGDRFKYIDALLENRALSPVSTPPLSELPAWETRAEKLAEVGIVTIQDFLDADDDVLKEAFNYKTMRTINKWKQELQHWLVMDEPPNKKR